MIELWHWDRSDEDVFFAQKPYMENKISKGVFLTDSQLAELKQEIWNAARLWEVTRLVPMKSGVVYQSLADYETQKLKGAKS